MAELVIELLMSRWPRLFTFAGCLMGGHGVPGIVRPGMLGIASLQFLLYLRIAVFPEPLQVTGDLNGTPRWGQKMNEDRHAPACHRGSYGEAKELPGV